MAIPQCRRHCWRWRADIESARAATLPLRTASGHRHSASRMASSFHFGSAEMASPSAPVSASGVGVKLPRATHLLIVDERLLQRVLDVAYSNA